jgi:CubicO group peptidase (beta-lactamase class C family)
VMEPDPSGTFVASSFMLATARDWARFGLLHLHDGVWQGRRILPEGFVAYVSTASPTAPIGEYGGQWWTNAGKPGAPSERRFPSAPIDTYQASGFQGQAVIVIPSRDVVIVRMGMTHDRSVLDLDGVIARVLAALPSGV